MNDRSIEFGSYVDNDPMVEFIVQDENPILKPTLNNVRITFGPACDTCSLSEVDKSRLIIRSEGGRQRFAFKAGVLAPGSYAVKLLATDFKGNVSGRNLCETAFKIADSKFMRHFQLYPNPAVTTASILFELSDRTALQGQDLECSISDWTGRVVRKVKVANAEITTGSNIIQSALSLTTADGTGMRPGVYLVTLNVGGSVPIYDKAGKATNSIRLIVQ